MTLLLFFILTNQHTWEFLTIEEHTRSYCEYLAQDLKRAFTDTPGNMRAVCTDNEWNDA